jgi:branched-chain amino acid transport system substrate-binding protein
MKIRRALALAAALTLVVGACGSDDGNEGAKAPESANEQPAGVSEPGPEAVPEEAGAPAGEAAPDGAAPGAASNPSAAAAPASAGTGGPGTGGAKTPSGGSAAAPAAPGSKQAAGGTNALASSGAPSPGGATPTPAPAPAPPTGDGPQDTSPIVIGSIGTMSGPAGDVIKRIYEGVQVWAAATNAKGGIQGHPIKHVVSDDGGDPARHKAELRRLVEQENVVALVGNPDALTGYAGVDYIRDKQVAYIGGDGGGDWFYNTPFHFPQGAVGVPLAEAEIRDVGLYGKQHKKTKFGTLTCTEVDICRVFDKIWNEKASSYGLKPLYRGRTSLVQPDFTAECLAAQREGVELLEVALDTNSIGRLAASCARQGFRPIYGFPAGLAKDNQKADPNLEGARSTLPTFSWLQNDSPAAGEFQEAMKRYGKALLPVTAGHTGGWTAGKLFEKGVVAGGAAGKVTRATLLAGLYTIKNETLGGITSPLTFAAGQNAKRETCSSQIEIKDGNWRLIDGGKFACGNVN